MRRQFLKSVVLGVLAASLGLPASQADAQDAIKIATEGAYFPWNYIDADGNLVGWDVDIANALCAEMDVSCEIMAQDWEGIIPGLLAQKYDVIVASMSMTPARAERVAFTDKYKDLTSRFVAPIGTVTDTSPEGMAGKRIGVQKGSAQNQWLDENDYGEAAEIVLYDTTQGPELDLVAGRIDAMIGNDVTYYVNFMQKPEAEGFEFVGDQIPGRPAGIALRKGEDELRERFNAAIAAILEDGTYDEITEKYFPFPVIAR